MTRNENSALIPERNPVTHKKHRREVFRQITLPLIGILLFFIALAVVLAIQSEAGASLWADISLIWILIPVCIGGLLLLAILVGLVFLQVKLIQVIPVWSFKLQDTLNTVGAMVRTFGNKVVAPLLKVNGFWAGVKAADRSLRRR